MYNQNLYKNIILHLSLIAGVGPATIKTILKNFAQQDLEQLYKMRVPDLCERGLTYDRATKVVAGLQDQSILNKELELTNDSSYWDNHSEVYLGLNRVHLYNWAAGGMNFMELHGLANLRFDYRHNKFHWNNFINTNKYQKYTTVNGQDNYNFSCHTTNVI